MGAFDDCDDDDPNTYPGAAENESLFDCMTDPDGDGYGAQTSAGMSGTDCDDNDASRHPNAPETPEMELILIVMEMMMIDDVRK